MPRFSESSRANLDTCHRSLQLMCEAVIIDYDFTVTEGFRDKERQTRMVEEGKSQVEWPNSKHNSRPSHAVDVAPFPVKWKEHGRFRVLAGHMAQAFAMLQAQGVIAERWSLRWGGDWDGDRILDDQTFNDLPHFEIVS